MYQFSISRKHPALRFYAGLILFAVLLLMAATDVKAITYTAFNNVTYELTPWEGSNIVVLTRNNGLDVPTMNNIVEKLDQAWDIYADLTGRIPTLWDNYTSNGLGTIAEVPDGQTCGAGCAFLGLTGIELTTTSWEILYNGVIDENWYDQVLFFELGRNFWLYGDQLGTIEPFVTGFAIANRFVSMAEVNVRGAPFHSMPFDDFKQLVTEDLIAAYQADPNLNWRSTLAAGQGVPGQRYDGAADLAGAILHRIYEDHGYTGYRRFWREMNEQPPATTAEDAMVNFIMAAYLATGQDYRTLLKAEELPDPGPESETVTIDIKPGDPRNIIKPNRRGVVWVAVLSDIKTPFDPLQIDISSLRFGPDQAAPMVNRVWDVNRDGMDDLLIRFRVRSTGIVCGDIEATLTGATHDGRDIAGSDTIKTVGCKYYHRWKNKHHYYGWKGWSHYHKHRNRLDRVVTHCCQGRIGSINALFPKDTRYQSH